ncbi:hypothetical protein [Nocardia callitridis]
MAVHVMQGLITADLTEHQARSAGSGQWAVSYLPGRTVGLDQAVAAIQLAEVTGEAMGYAELLELPLLEAVGGAMAASTWRRPKRGRRYWPRRREDESPSPAESAG